MRRSRCWIPRSPSTSGGSVPDSIVRLARETGSVLPNERVDLVFISANRTFAEGMLLTDSAIIRRTLHGIIGARSSIATSTSNPSSVIIRRADSSSWSRRAQLPTRCIRT
jgi:hypothetical protein